MSKKTKTNHTLNVFNKDLSNGILNSTLTAALLSKDYMGKYHDPGVFLDPIAKTANKASDGDLTDMEAMLASQAIALDTLFSSLVHRSCSNMGQYFDAANEYMKLALKAQTQCKTTIESLANIKQSKIVVQNNIAQYQQVNNDGQITAQQPNAIVHNPAEPVKMDNATNELLDHEKVIET